MEPYSNKPIPSHQAITTLIQRSIFDHWNITFYFFYTLHPLCNVIQEKIMFVFCGCVQIFQNFTKLFVPLLPSFASNVTSHWCSYLHYRQVKFLQSQPVLYKTLKQKVSQHLKCTIILIIRVGLMIDLTILWDLKEVNLLKHREQDAVFYFLRRIEQDIVFKYSKRYQK